MQNQKTAQKAKGISEDKEWVYEFQTWKSKCPKSIADFDDDKELFMDWAYSRVWLDPSKYLCEYMTQEEGIAERPPIPDHLDPWAVNYAKQRKSALTHSQFEELTDT